MNYASVLALLREAKTLIADPAKWAHHPSERRAARGHGLCSVDALQAAGRHLYSSHDYWVAGHLLGRAIGHRDISGVPHYNDHPVTTHADIMTMFDRAIAEAERLLFRQENERRVNLDRVTVSVKEIEQPAPLPTLSTNVAPAKAWWTDLSNIIAPALKTKVAPAKTLEDA